MFEYVWPMLVVILCSVFYNITAKSTPENANPLFVIVITYIVGAIVSMILYLSVPSEKNIMTEVSKLNWTSFVLGISIVGLEVGNIYMYRAGWNISIGSLVANIILAIILVIVGVLFYKEQINLYKVIGIAFCLLGLVLINKK